jgi:hypothetical protein
MTDQRLDRASRLRKHLHLTGYLLLVCFVSALPPVYGAEPTPASLVVKAELGRDSYGRYLLFTLTSKERSAIEILRRRLPWRAAAEADILLAAVDADTRDVLPRVDAVDDPEPEADADIVRLAPGQSTDGRLYLGSVFDMSAARPRREVVIFWAYRAAVLGRPPGERIVGSLTVSLRD